MRWAVERARADTRPGLRGTVCVALLLAATVAGCTSTASTPIGDGSGVPHSADPSPSSSPPAPTASVTVGNTTTTVRTTPPATGYLESSTTTPSRSTTSAPAAVTSTVTRTRPGKTVTLSVPPPKATHEPPATVGDCPYLSADVVSDITGQHHGPTMTVDLQPAPMCVFYRSDGQLMGSVRVIEAAGVAEAVAAVNQHVPIADSQPASQPPGWVGGSMTSPGQMTQDSSGNSVYGVSKGNIAVVAQEDESPSIKARVMAVCAIYGLKLAAGPAPDYCAGTQG